MYEEHFIGIVVTPIKILMPCRWHCFPVTKVFRCRWSIGFWMMFGNLSASHHWKLPDFLGRIHFKTNNKVLKKCTFQLANGTPTGRLYCCQKTPSKQASRIFKMRFKIDNAKGVRWEKWTLHSVTLQCLKHVGPSLLACWPAEHPQRAPSASSRCHTSENQDALAKGWKCRSITASQHAPHTRPTVCDTYKKQRQKRQPKHYKVVGRAEHGTSRLAVRFKWHFHRLSGSLHRNIEPSHVSRVPGPSAICNLKWITVD